MHGEINASIQQSFLNLLGEQPLAPFVCQWPILDGTPLVRMTTSSTPSSLTPVAAASRERTMRACTNASGLPRVPMRKEAWIAPYNLAMLGRTGGRPRGQD